MEAIRVAVTGMGNPLGQNIYKALRMSSLPLRLYMLDAYPFSAGLLWEGQPVVCSLVNHPNYIDQFINFLNREQIDIIFFGTEAEPRAISAHLARIREQTNTRFVLNTPEALSVADDKLLTALRLQEAGLPAPASADAADRAAVAKLIEAVDFPVIIKPRHGSASRGLARLHRMQELESHLQSGNMVQECLLPDDQEYTVGVYRCRDGSIAAATTIHRELNFGLTYKGVVISHPQIEDYAIQVIKALDVYASCNVQLRLTARGPIAFEVNPRFSSTTPIRAHFGVNEPELAIRELVLGETLDRISCRPGGMLRYWTEHYLEQDELEAVQRVDTTFWESGQ